MSIFSTAGGASFGGTANIITIEDERVVLQREINRLNELIKYQEEQIEKLQSTPAGFTKDQLKLLIQKLHPDKNAGSVECAILFKKLMDLKNG